MSANKGAGLDPSQGLQADTITSEELRAALLEVLPAKDMQVDTSNTLRKSLEEHLGFPADSLLSKREEIKEIAAELIQCEAQPHGEVEELGEEDMNASKSMYLVTLSHPKQARAKDG